MATRLRTRMKFHPSILVLWYYILQYILVQLRGWTWKTYAASFLLAAHSQSRTYWHSVPSPPQPPFITRVYRRSYRRPLRCVALIDRLVLSWSYSLSHPRISPPSALLTASRCWIHPMQVRAMGTILVPVVMRIQTFKRQFQSTQSWSCFLAATPPKSTANCWRAEVAEVTASQNRLQNVQPVAHVW